VPTEENRDRKAVVAARKKFEANCGTSTNKWKEVGSVAIISGGGVGAVGVFDIPKPQTARDELR
jgi:hypothetical protein